MAVAKAPALHAGRQIIRRDVDQHGQRGLVKRDFDFLTAASAAARLERGEYRVAGQHAGANVHDGDAVSGWWATGMTAYAHQPRFSLQHKIVARLCRFWPAAAVTRDRAAHQARRVLFEPRIGEPPF